MYTCEQENALLQQAQHGNKTACEQLLAAYAGLLKKMAHRYQHTPAGREIADDASGILQLAFMEAVQDFVPERGVHFAAFLQSRLHGAIYQAFQHTIAYSQRTAHSATTADNTAWYDLTASPAPSPERIICARDELAGLIRQLNAPERQLLQLIYWQELPQKSIAQKLHLSPQAISKRKKQLLTKLKKLA